MDTADRNYIENLIGLAQRQTGIARAVANSFGLDATTERLTWAIDFLDAAEDKLPAMIRNPDGTVGPEHVTSEGVELGPPKG